MACLCHAVEKKAYPVDEVVKGGRFDGFLFLSRQPRQAIGEGVGDAEFHGATYRRGRYENRGAIFCA